MYVNWKWIYQFSTKDRVFSLHVVLTGLSTNYNSALCQEDSGVSIKMPRKWVIPPSPLVFCFVLYCFQRKEENLAFTFSFYVNIWHGLGMRIHEELSFQTHSWVAGREFHPNILSSTKSKTFLLWKIGFRILFLRVKWFIIKSKSLPGWQRAHKEKTFRWVRPVNQ